METVTLSGASLTLQRIINEGHRYHPFQLMELLQRLLDPSVSIKVLPSDSLAFPASDVERVVQHPDGEISVRVRFDGLYGVDSPLPHYFLEDATVDTDFAERIRAFLDLFNLPFYQLQQEVWQSSRFYDQSAEQPGPLSRVMSKILPAALSAVPECSQYPGVYLHGHPGTKTLAAMLRNLLQCPGLKLDAETCSWQPLSQPSCLGQPLVVKGNLALGRRVPVRGQLLIIRMGKLSSTEIEHIHPGGTLSRPLARALKAALPDDIAWAVEFFARPDSEPLKLGVRKMALGRTTTLSNRQEKWIRQRYVCNQYRYLTQGLN